MRLGTILVNHGWIEQEKLNQGLQLQNCKARRIGQILLQEKWIQPDHLKQALLEQYWRNNGYWVID